MKKFYVSVFTLFVLLTLFGSASAQNDNSQTTNAGGEKIYRQSEVDQKAKVTKRYFPKTDQMCDQLSGKTKTLVTLDKSGKVSDVKLLAGSGCKRFDENSLKSSLNIKFDPAIKDGQPVSVTVIIMYEFHSY